MGCSLAKLTQAAVKYAEEPWDPFKPGDWDTSEAPTRQTIVRISSDVQAIMKDESNGIYIYPREDDITEMIALIVGASTTPYAGGFFIFFIRCPSNYPFSPPKVRFLTSDVNCVRFNPNIYKNGKVCLSILNTWDGPRWHPTLTLEGVLNSIRSLLNDRPYHNEPGYSKERKRGHVQNYNDVIQHESLRAATVKCMHEMVFHGPFKNPWFPCHLRTKMIENFLKNYDLLTTVARKKSAELDGMAFRDPFGTNRGTFDFAGIIKELESVFDTLVVNSSASLSSVNTYKPTDSEYMMLTFSPGESDSIDEG